MYEGEEVIDEWNYLNHDKEVIPDCKGTSLIRTKFYFALNTLAERKATGIDNIPVEILKKLDEFTNSLLFNIIGKCYETGKLLNNFIKRKSIKIPKKENATNYTNYRIITLFHMPRKYSLTSLKIG